MVCRSDFLVTDATVADCSVAETLIAEFQAEYLLTDRWYDTDAIIRHALGIAKFRYMQVNTL